MPGELFLRVNGKRKPITLDEARAIQERSPSTEAEMVAIWQEQQKAKRFAFPKESKGMEVRAQA